MEEIPELVMISKFIFSVKEKIWLLTKIFVSRFKMKQNNIFLLIMRC